MKAFIGLLLFTSSIILAQPIKISGKNFTEQKIISEITRLYLIAKGYKVKRGRWLNTREIRQSILDNKTDIYWEYTGTAFLSFHQIKPNKQDADEVYQQIKSIDREFGIIWLKPSKINNTYALAIKPGFSPQISKISQLAKLIDEGKSYIFGCSFEFCRFNGQVVDFQKAYYFNFEKDNIKVMDLSEIYQRLADGTIDIGLIFSTNSKLRNAQYTLLQDDENFLTSYNLTPLIRDEILIKHPKLAEHLNKLATFLDNPTIINLNAKVEIDKVAFKKVAKQFLLEQKLISAPKKKTKRRIKKKKRYKRVSKKKTKPKKTKPKKKAVQPANNGLPKSAFF